MHHFNPIPQTIHNKSQGKRVIQIKCISTACIICVVARIIGQPIVAGVIKPTKRQRRAQLGAFRAVVIDYVQNHLDPRAVKAGNHLLEFGNFAGLHIARLGRKEPVGHVPPVIRQSAVDQKLVV